MDNSKPDTLIVEGIPGLDGSYSCDLVGMNTIGDPECMTNREGHRVKELSGARAGEILDELVRADTDIHVALATVILERHGRRVNVDMLLDAPIGSGISFSFGSRNGDDADPPAEPSPHEEPSSGQPGKSQSGGGDSE